MGATAVPGNQIATVLDNLMSDNALGFDRRLLESWAWNAKQIWNNLIA
jgi:hypothetical protein